MITSPGTRRKSAHYHANIKGKTANLQNTTVLTTMQELGQPTNARMLMKAVNGRGYNMDCVEYMHRIPTKYFELAIVDPPYGIGQTWSKSKRDRFYHQGKMHSYENEIIPTPEYFTELVRVSKNQIVFGGNYFTMFLPPTNAWIVWDKCRNAEITFMSEAELAWSSFSKVTRVVQLLWDGARKCEPTKKIHPHQKPVSLYKWILKRYAKPGDKILDTHIGSGSSRIAAHDMGFDFYGTELDPEYFKSMEKRYRQHIAQQKLFQIDSTINH